jgi:ligand-binding SRPBCC domain-containing protein
MATVHVETYIAASPEVCFDLARDIDIHLQSAASTGEKAVDGVTTGKMGMGDFVTFDGRHFGVRFRLTSEIIQYDSPHQFTDQMKRGPFKSMMHEHIFESRDGGTVMIDKLDFHSPMGPLGALVDTIVMKRHLTKFLQLRGAELKHIAES